MPPDSQYSMLPHYQFEFHTKVQNFKKNVFMIYAYVIHTCLDVATKTRKLQKKCIHDICLCYSYMSRCGTNGRESVPSVISKEHLPTSAAYSQPLVEAIILTCAKIHQAQLSQKMQKLAC